MDRQGDVTHFLPDLIAAAGLTTMQPLPRLPVLDIQTDSRQVRPGSLFVAYKGITADRHDFIAAAVKAGAVAVVAERPPEEPISVPLVLTDDGRRAWARLAAAWHGFPGRRLRVAGITGTDGKTTTASLLHHILSVNGVSTGLISTVRAVIGIRLLDTGLHTTTPPPSAVQALLAEMVAAGCSAAVLEATSEGLAQERLEGCEFDLAILTNVTHDHLYFHGSFAAYREAKAKLFRYLAPSARKPGTPKVAIVNADDPSAAYFSAIEADRHLTYGRAPSDLRIEDVISGSEGVRFSLTTPWGTTAVALPLLGEFNAHNATAAIAAACSWSVSLADAAEACASFPGIPGRMQVVNRGQPFAVVVDFAHTAYALEQALRALRPLTAGRLIVVFGCAGERDVLKRAPMARTAVTLADLAVFTAEDPRTEDLDSILAQMAEGARAAGAQEGRDFRLIPDRAEAIREAVSLARPGDSVILCGKGHEQSMCYGREERPWDEVTAAISALASLGYG